MFISFSCKDIDFAHFGDIVTVYLKMPKNGVYKNDWSAGAESCRCAGSLPLLPITDPCILMHFFSAFV